MFYKRACFFYRCGSSFCKYSEFTCNNIGRHKTSGIDLCLWNTHQIAGSVHFNLYICATFLILNTAVCVVAHICHTHCGDVHIGMPIDELVIVFVKVVFELLILKQYRNKRHHYSSAIPFRVVHGICFKNLGVFVIHTGYYWPSAAVIYNKMIGIRPHGRLIFSDCPVIYHADRALFWPVHAAAYCLDCLYNCSAKSSLCAVSILGWHFHLFVF